MSIICGSPRDAETDQERSAIRETSRSRVPYGQGRESKDERRHAWALQTDAENDSIAATPHSDGASVLCQKRSLGRTIHKTKNPDTGIHFWRTSDESPDIMIDDLKNQMSKTTEMSVGPFAAVDVRRTVKDLPNYKTDPNIVKNEGESLTSGVTTKFYLSVITTFCVKVWSLLG